ncbi:MAG: hypothetical protein KA045_01755 [Burkholderiaceae bacterium]|nr:hypothetical protein [Burkholderiaceae bacterium]
MASTARKKIDSQTMQLFDSEVDKPEHDDILVRLFQDDARLISLLTEFHGLKPLAPFTEETKFAMGPPRGVGGNQLTSLAEATRLTGVAPSWKSNSPIRLVKKEMEVLMNYTRDPLGRYSRLIGFIDIGVSYQVLKMPFIERHPVSKEYEWSSENEVSGALFEVKSAWPTSGNLIRQLNLYRSSIPSGIPTYGDGSYHHFVVGPDDSVNDLANQHGYRLVTFDSKGENFRLVPGTLPTRRREQIPGQF